MPKMQVYLPADLYEKVKAHADELNVSRILQDALVAQLAAIERREAAADAVATYTSTHGKFTEDELDRQRRLDDAAAKANRASPTKSRR